MKKLLFLLTITITFLLSSCENLNDPLSTYSSEGYDPLAMIFSSTIGFDDFSSSGAALSVTVDKTKPIALVMACKFDLPTSEVTIKPGSNFGSILPYYSFGTTNSVVDSITSLYPQVSGVVTNTGGIRSMNNSLTAFLVMTQPDGTDKYFLAIEGSMKLSRLDGSKNIAEGSLNFIEITDASKTGNIVASGEKYSLENIYVQWDTSKQPK